jgi:hypothetical protein
MPQRPAPASAPVLTYVPAPRVGPLRRWLRPGSPGFVILILLLAGAGTWEGWKWRLREDEKAFDQCASIYITGKQIDFTAPPTRAALRHLAFLQGPWTVDLNWAVPSQPISFEAFRGIPLANVQKLNVGRSIASDSLLNEIVRSDSGLTALTILDLGASRVTDVGIKELCRSDSGLKALSILGLDGTRVADAGLKELSRPDTGLKALAILSLRNTYVTDVGLDELSRPDTGLKALTILVLDGTWVTDAGLKDLSRPDNGLKALTTLYVGNTKVTSAGIEALRKARPGLTINP